MKKFNLLGFIVRSVMMGMIAALFLFTFFPHLMSPVVNEPAAKSNPVLAPMSFAEGINKVASSVVQIRTIIPSIKSGNSQPSITIGFGSGVIVSPQGYIVTNNHVISKAKEIAVELTDGRRTIAEVVGFDVETDLAVLKISLDKLQAVRLDSDVKVQVGDIALVIGNPFGVGQTVTMGIISATGRQFLGLSEYENYIQTDAVVNHGNSGGALINTEGELLAISSAYLGYAKTGISFAIPISLAIDVVEQIILNGKVIRGWWGFVGGPLSKPGRDKYGDKAYVIESITPEGPADLAGLEVQDIIISVNNREIASARDLHNMIAESKPGSEFEFKVIRKDATQILKIVSQERPQVVND